ncbi:cellulose synthase-like protein D1-like [Trifolium medium]|uniref:Cellulose synthase-like protein D1-like n=1 Tax=Trifolium medium TaxID=97028 RepID=A0A392P7B8_9FABA|nr:cellulose synthase-like protein D1-like [Trifolium medium]
MYNTREEKKEKQLLKEKNGGVLPPDQTIDVPKATWMADGTHWPGTWYNSTADHAKGDHAGILQVMSKVPEHDPVMGYADEKRLDFTGVDIRVPMFAYVSREKRPGFLKDLKGLILLIDMQITTRSSLMVIQAFANI